VLIGEPLPVTASLTIYPPFICLLKETVTANNRQTENRIYTEYMHKKNTIKRTLTIGLQTTRQEKIILL